jgi:hypothetical protein
MSIVSVMLRVSLDVGTEHAGGHPAELLDDDGDRRSQIIVSRPALQGVAELQLLLADAGQEVVGQHHVLGMCGLLLLAALLFLEHCSNQRGGGIRLRLGRLDTHVDSSSGIGTIVSETLGTVR